MATQPPRFAAAPLTPDTYCVVDQHQGSCLKAGMDREEAEALAAKLNRGHAEAEREVGPQRELMGI